MTPTNLSDHDIIEPEVMPREDASLVADTVDEANRLQAFIADCDAQSKRYAEAAMLATIKLGGMLADIRERCKHGEWERLFAGAEKRIKCDPNGNHGCHFNFSRESSRRYISLYKRVMDQCGPMGRQLCLSSEHCYDEIDATTSKLLAHVTQGAETPRQMMLNLGVISERKGANLDRDRNTKGRPRKSAIEDPEDAARKALELERGDAEGHAESMMNELILFARLNRGTLICRETREKLRTLLLETANLLKDVNDR